MNNELIFIIHHWLLFCHNLLFVTAYIIHLTTQQHDLFSLFRARKDHDKQCLGYQQDQIIFGNYNITYAIPRERIPKSRIPFELILNYSYVTGDNSIFPWRIRNNHPFGGYLKTDDGCWTNALSYSSYSEQIRILPGMTSLLLSHKMEWALRKLPSNRCNTSHNA